MRDVQTEEQGTVSQFESSVRIEPSEPVVRGKKRPLDKTYGLDISFMDFLGNPASDTGEVVITTDNGVLTTADGEITGGEISIGPDSGIVAESGVLRVNLVPEDYGGIVNIGVTCALGSDKLELDIPSPSGFAFTEILESVIYAFLVAIVIRIFFFQTFWIPSGSMEPTLYEGDRIIANKLVYRVREPERGEVVIFRVYQAFLSAEADVIENSDMIIPVGAGNRDTNPGVISIGGPGKLTIEEAYDAGRDRLSRQLQRYGGNEGDWEVGIEVQDYIKRVIGLPGDVVEVSEGIIYVNDQPLAEEYETLAPDYNNYGPRTVPPGEIFVLGDNRANSQDSHVIGTIPIRNVEGRAEMIFWPLERIGIIPD